MTPDAHAGTGNTGPDGTVVWGPRPPTAGDDPPPVPRARWWTPLVRRPIQTGFVAAVVGLGLLGTAGLLTGARAESPGAGRCPTPAPPGPAHIADVDGDGCDDVVLWDGPSATASVHHAAGTVDHFTIGEPGDDLRLGDWDCDGTATPALVLTGGETFVFDEWPHGGTVEARRVDAGTVEGHTC